MQRAAGCPFPPRTLPAAWPCGFYGVVIVVVRQLFNLPAPCACSAAAVEAEMCCLSVRALRSAPRSRRTAASGSPQPLVGGTATLPQPSPPYPPTPILTLLAHSVSTGMI